MQNDVLDYNDCVIDDQTHGCGQAAERHQIETLAKYLKHDKSDQHCDGYHQPGNHRGPPIAQKHNQDDRREDQANQNGVTHALDGLADDD